MRIHLPLLILLLIIVPSADFVLLLAAGGYIGWAETLMLAIFTGIVGASLAKQQGLRVWHEIQQTLAQGQLPGAVLIDGAMILFAGAVLLTPGFITDALGFLFLIPITRSAFRKIAMRYFHSRIQARKSSSGSGQSWRFSTRNDNQQATDINTSEIIDMDPPVIVKGAPKELPHRKTPDS
jgi:UPF0716 protein FxsA